MKAIKSVGIWSTALVLAFFFAIALTSCGVDDGGERGIASDSVITRMEVCNAAGIVVRSEDYSYDEIGRLQRVTLFSDEGVGYWGDYDGDGLRLSCDVVDYEYGSDGGLVRVLPAYQGTYGSGFDVTCEDVEGGLCYEQWTASGMTRAYECKFGADGLIDSFTKRIHLDSVASYDPAVDNSFAFHFDERGHLISAIWSDGGEITAEWEWGAAGTLVDVRINGQERTEDLAPMEFDEKGNLTKVYAQDGSYVSFEYEEMSSMDDIARMRSTFLKAETFAYWTTFRGYFGSFQ